MLPVISWPVMYCGFPHLFFLRAQLGVEVNLSGNGRADTGFRFEHNLGREVKILSPNFKRIA